MGPGSSGRKTLVETPALDRPTLERFYREVLQPSFAEAELATLDDLCRQYLVDRAGSPAALLLDDGQPVAGILAEIYPVSHVLLVTYLAVHPEHRSLGTATALLAETISRWQSSLRPALMIAEIEDPRFHAPNADKGDPVARLRLYDRMGARLLAMPYFQPSLRPGSPRIRDMFLITSGVAGDAVPGQAVAAFLKEYFEQCEGPSALTDPDYLALVAWTEARSGRIPLWSLDRFPEVPRLTTKADRQENRR